MIDRFRSSLCGAPLACFVAGANLEFVPAAGPDIHDCAYDFPHNTQRLPVARGFAIQSRIVDYVNSAWIETEAPAVVKDAATPPDEVKPSL